MAKPSHSPFESLTSRPNHPLRILIVEDTPADVELMVSELTTAQIPFIYQTIHTFEQLRSALLGSWDVVLSDVQITDATVDQILAALQQSPLQIPLILVTGTVGEEAAVDYIKAGVTDYVLKDRLVRLPLVLQRSLREFTLRRQQQLAQEHIQQQAIRASIISRIVQAMRGSLVFEEVLQTTVDQLHQALGVSRCLIFLPTEQQRMISHYVSQDTPERAEFTGIQCPLFDYFINQVPALKIIQIEDAAQSDNPVVRQFTSDFNIQAMLTVPLRYQTEHYGGICLHQCDRPRYWTPEEVDLIKAIADQCAIALYQSRLFQHLQAQAQREHLLNQIARALNSSLDPDYILQKIVQMTGECFHVDRAFIFAFQADVVQITHEWRADDTVVSMLRTEVAIANWLGTPIPQYTTPLHVPDPQSLSLNPEQWDCIQRTGRKSLLSVPIFVRDQFFGGIELHTTTQPRHFKPDEINLLQQIADQAAIALYNAQSYERLEALVQERTRELEVEKQLSDTANQAKSDFLANMSHELRTPLTSILGFSSVLLKQVFGKLEDKQIQYVENIHASGEHLLELINDLLDLSKIEAGREELVRETIYIDDLCATCLESLQEQINQRQLTLHYRVPSDLTCCADRRRLKQILLNLLSNAVKFTDRGSITLDVSTEGDRLKFAVTDTGIGIATENLSRLFKPFHQVQSGLDRQYQGTGLGLTLALKLAQLHGGTITVQSALSVGSCFTLELPYP